MKNLKLLIVTQYFWPENFKINDLAVHFSKKGYEIDVLTSIPNYPDGVFYEGYGIFKKRYEKYNDISIHRVPVIPRGSATKIRLFLNYISYVISASIKILQLKKRYDIIFIYEPSPVTVALPAILLKKIKKIPINFWVTDLWPESVVSAGNLKSNFIPKLLNPIVKFIYHNCDKILVTSEGFIESIVSKGINRKKIIFLPQWAESIFKPKKQMEDLNQLRIPSNAFKIMFAGNIGESQDFPSLIKAAKILENSKIHWIIIGNGRRSDWLKEKIIEKNLKKFVHVIQRQPIERMPKIYAFADAMILSLKNEYIFSITIPAKLQSYLACGKPVLGMINGEAAKIVNESGAGLACKAEDYKSFASLVKKMSTMDSAELKSISKKALLCSDKLFKRETLLNKIENIFYETIKLKYK